MSPRIVFYNSNKSQGTYEESKECEIAQNWRASAETSFWELQQPGLSPPLRSQTFCPNCWQAGLPTPAIHPGVMPPASLLGLCWAAEQGLERSPRAPVLLVPWGNSDSLQILPVAHPCPSSRTLGCRFRRLEW